MTRRRLLLRSGVALLGFLAVLACGARASADTLILGSTYGPAFNIKWTDSFLTVHNETGQGGNFAGSTLNGVALTTGVYCVDLLNNIAASPPTYNDTVVSSTGVLTGIPTPPEPWSDMQLGQVAWLMDHYAAGAVGNSVNQGALQLAIWQTLWVGVNLQVTATSNDGVIQLGASNMIAAMDGSVDPISNLDWLSPGITGNSTIYQRLVTIAPTPEPASFAMAGTAIVAFAGLALRRRMKKA